MQAIYGFYQTGNDNLPIAEKNMLASIEKFYDLYITLLSALVEVVHEAQRQAEEGKQKLLPTADDLNPNLRLVNNRLAAQLQENIDYKIWTEKLKINWSSSRDIFRKLFNKIKQTSDYSDYMNKNVDSYENDKAFLIDIFKNYLCEDEAIVSYFEEYSIFWADDFYNAAGLIFYFLKAYTSQDSKDKPFPTLFESHKTADAENDAEFVTILFRKSILQQEFLEELIQSNATNWEYERVAFIDNILLKMAIVELMEFSQIPIKVTLNEYIEIAKDFSTEKSNVFINGILDSIIKLLTNEGKIKKIGRGLIQ